MCFPRKMNYSLYFNHTGSKQRQPDSHGISPDEESCFAQGYMFKLSEESRAQPKTSYQLYTLYMHVHYTYLLLRGARVSCLSIHSSINDVLLLQWLLVDLSSTQEEQTWAVFPRLRLVLSGLLLTSMHL